MFQTRFGKVYEFGWWDMEIVQNDAVTHFTSKEFQGDCYVRGIWLVLAAPDHQEMNGWVEVTWQKFQTIAHSIMVHSHISDKYKHFELMYTTGYIFPMLPIKNLFNKYGKPTTPYKLATDTKPSVSNPHILIYPCVVQKATAHVDTKLLKMCHQPQEVFRLSLLEFHNIKNINSSTYVVHGTFFFTRCCIWWNIFYCVSIHVMSVFRCTRYATSRLV